MISEPVSYVKALQDYFSDNSDGHGRKIEMSEFKELNDDDKDDFRVMLTDAGYKLTK